MTTVRFTIESDHTIDLEMAVTRLLRLVQSGQPVTMHPSMVLNIEAQLCDTGDGVPEDESTLIIDSGGWDDWPLDRSHHHD